MGGTVQESVFNLTTEEDVHHIQGALGTLRNALNNQGYIHEQQ